jgi:acyl carrier protein
MAPTAETQLVEFLCEQIAIRTKAVASTIHADSLLVELGLESLDAVLLCGDVEDRFGVDVDPAAIFEHETLGAFARSVLQRTEH